MKKRVLIFTICTLLTGALFGQNNVEKSDNYLLVKGVAILKEIPQIISVTINVKTDSPVYAKCQEQMLMLINKTKRIIIKNGIDADLIKMNEIKVTEDIEYSRGERIKKGYEGAASFGIESEFSTDFTNKLIAALINDSIMITYKIDFKLSEAQKLSIRQKAIKLAIADATENAKIISESSNIILLNINSIEYRNDDYAYQNVERDIISTDNWVERNDRTGSVSYNQTADLHNQTTDFNPKEIGLKKSVQIKWLINDK